MAWRTLAATFLLVFVAELGDKTQLATMLLAAQNRSPWIVFAGAALALVLTSLLGVAAGTAISRTVPPTYLRAGGGIAFLIMGSILLLSRK